MCSLSYGVQGVFLCSTISTEGEDRMKVALNDELEAKGYHAEEDEDFVYLYCEDILLAIYRNPSRTRLIEEANRYCEENKGG